MKYLSLVLMTLFMFASGAMAFDAKKFFKSNCTACHLIGGGDKTGPDLAGVSKRRTVEWIVKFMNYPEGMINGDSDEEDYPVKKGTLKGKAISYGDKVAYSLYQMYKPSIMTEHEVDATQVKALLKYIDSVATTPKGKIVKFKALPIK
jgi:mono/diheme cytochrome c family protein